MIELHRKLLGDDVRNKAFAEALRRVIVPGETTIADIGAGTGFLSFLAMRLGAKHAMLVEYSDMLMTAKKLALRNHIDHCTFVHKHSMDLKTTEKFDIVLSETLGNYALEESIIESVEDAKRFLKPKGLIIPGMIRQFLCPVISDRLIKDIDIFPKVGFSLDLTEAREMSLNNMYVKTVDPVKDLPKKNDAIRLWDTVDFSKKNSSLRSATLKWIHPSTVYGFALWWEAELVPGVILSTSPFAAPTHWEQIFLPLLSPVTIGKGETLELQLKSDTRLSVKINLSWTARLLDTKGKELSVQRLDMRKGY